MDLQLRIFEVGCVHYPINPSMVQVTFMCCKDRIDRKKKDSDHMEVSKQAHTIATALELTLPIRWAPTNNQLPAVFARILVDVAMRSHIMMQLSLTRAKGRICMFIHVQLPAIPGRKSRPLCPRCVRVNINGESLHIGIPVPSDWGKISGVSFRE